MAIVWVTVLTKFQLASTAFTVTFNEIPAICAVGEPVLPLPVPGAAVSPGISTCSLVAAPALTVVAALTPVVNGPALVSLAVTVQEPAVLNVTEYVCVPPA